MSRSVQDKPAESESESESAAADQARTEEEATESAGPDLPDGQWRPGADTQSVDPETGTRTAADDPVWVSNDALVAVNLTREERVTLLTALGTLYTLHGRGELPGDRPLPEEQLRALTSKLRNGG